MNNQSKIRKYLTVFALGLAGGSIYCLPYIKYILYDAQIAVMGISNTQSGLIMTAYTVGNMLLYIPGGIIADKLSPRKSLTVSLIATTALGLFYAVNSSYKISILIWIGFSISSAFVFWSSLLKAVRLIGTEEEQGFIYGCYYACNGIAASVTNAIAVKVFGAAGDTATGFRLAVIVLAAVPAIAGIMLWFLMKDDKDEAETVSVEDDSNSVHVKDIGKALKNPIVWVFSLTVLIGYGFYTSSSYFTPYLTAVRGINPVDSGFISILRTNLMLLVAPLAGIIADKFFKSTARWHRVCFLILALLYAGCMVLPKGISSTAAAVYTLIPAFFAVMMYGIMFATISELGIPRAMTGTVIGVASIIGYLPDSVYSVIFGKFLDAGAVTGYNSIFTFLICTGILGMITTTIEFRYAKKIKAMEK